MMNPSSLAASSESSSPPPCKTIVNYELWSSDTDDEDEFDDADGEREHEARSEQPHGEALPSPLHKQATPKQPEEETTAYPAEKRPRLKLHEDHGQTAETDLPPRNEERQQQQQQQPSSSTTVTEAGHEGDLKDLDEVLNNTTSNQARRYAIDEKDLPPELVNFLSELKSFLTKPMNLQRCGPPLSQTTHTKMRERLRCK